MTIEGIALMVAYIIMLGATYLSLGLAYTLMLKWWGRKK